VVLLHYKKEDILFREFFKHHISGACSAGINLQIIDLFTAAVQGKVARQAWHCNSGLLQLAWVLSPFQKKNAPSDHGLTKFRNRLVT
jgi:hypothetical protein